MVSKYRELRDDEETVVDTKTDVFKVACCDCGVVHYISITVRTEDVVGVKFNRDKRATGQVRRQGSFGSRKR